MGKFIHTGQINNSQLMKHVFKLFLSFSYYKQLDSSNHYVIIYTKADLKKF